MRHLSSLSRHGIVFAAAVAFAAGLTPLASAQPCIEPDAGGTVHLPPAGCGYLSPDDVHILIDGLPPGTTIEIGIEHQKFFNVQRQPGGRFGPDGEIELFDSFLFMEMNGTGELAGFSRFIVMQVNCEVHTGPRTLGDPVQTFPNEMFQLQGGLFGDPDFEHIQIQAGGAFGLPSPGQTTLTDLGDGRWNVDSFFDVHYRIDFAGAPGSVLEGLGGTTDATVRMSAGEPVDGSDCALEEDFDDYPAGSVIVGQGGWEAWDNDPIFQDGIVTPAIARSLPHSLEIDASDDIVHQFSGVNSGRWKVRLHQYIPSGFSGQTFVILLNAYVPDGNPASKNWSTQVVADAATGNVQDFNGTGSAPIVFDAWIPIDVMIDFDLDRQVVTYNGQEIINDTWTGHVPPAGGLNLAALDLFSNGATRAFYDDVSVCPDPDPCPEDIDGSGRVDFGDILAVLGDWGPYAPCPPYKLADINRNCAVDFQDILAILAAWGPCIDCLIPNEDPFTTLTEPGAETTVEFGSADIPPIPADFFFPGSEPFMGQIPLAGFFGDDSDLHLVDTRVRRSGPVDFPGTGFPRPATPVQIEIVELSLTSVQPITVSGQNWVVAMGLSDNQVPGLLNATLESADGGQTQAVVPVRPRFIFAPEQDLDLLAQGVIQPEDVRLRFFDFDQAGLPAVNMGWDEPFPFSTRPPAQGFFNQCELGNPFPFFPGVPPGGGDDGADAPGLPPHIAAGGPGHLHYVCPPPPPPPGLCTYSLLGASPCFPVGGGGQCPAPPVGKILLPCGPLGPCPFFNPCPPFLIVIFPCQPPGTGFCVGFYRCTGCNPC